MFIRKIAGRDSSSVVTSYGATTGNSTLWNHLKRQHPKKYAKLLEIESADDPRSSLNQLFQSTINNHLRPAANQQKYTAGRLALACLKLIAACDLVCKFSLNLALELMRINSYPAYLDR